MRRRTLAGQGGWVSDAPEWNGDEEGRSYRRFGVSRRRRLAWRSGKALVGFLRTRVRLDAVVHTERRMGKHWRGSSLKGGPDSGAAMARWCSGR
jgi:hypothetical protein